MINQENYILLDLLDLLQKYTDGNHTLTQTQILNILKEEYGILVARKTVKNNMEKLMSYTKRLNYKTTKRRYINKKTNEKEIYETYTDFWYEHDFEPSELRLLIDSILFSKQIPSSQRADLIEKIEGLSSKYFNARMAHIHTLSSDESRNSQLFNTIAQLDDAITNQKQVAFYYNKYQINERAKLELTPQLTKDGEVREYVMNPYQIVTANGHYYLICNNDKYDNLSHYRLDRITECKMLKRRRKKIEKVEGQRYGLNLSQHMAEHIYMFRGESSSVQLRFDKRLLSDFVDWFGTEQIHFSNQTEEQVTARVTVNLMAMRKWALQYATHVRVLSPQSLVDEIREDIQKAVENYQ